MCQCVKLRPSLWVPYPDDSVIPTAGKQAPIGRKCHAVDMARMPARPKQRAGGDIPQFDLYLKPSLYPACFVNDLSAKEAAVLAATQRPIALSALATPSGTPAWKTIPSWYLVGTLDNVIPPYAQLFMAQRANAHISQVKASHPSMIARPDAAADIIKAAARATN